MGLFWWNIRFKKDTTLHGWTLCHLEKVHVNWWLFFISFPKVFMNKDKLKPRMFLQWLRGSTVVMETLTLMAHMHSYSLGLKGMAVHRPLLGKRLTLIKINWLKNPIIAVFFFQDGCRVKPYHYDTAIKTSCIYLVPTIFLKGVTSADAVWFCKHSTLLLQLGMFHYMIMLWCILEREIIFTT